MSTDDHDRWKALTVRRPGDVPAATPLAWLVEKFTGHNDRLMNNALPADVTRPVQRSDAGDALAALALHHDIEVQRASRVREAIELGATWSQVAAALDITPDAARALLRDWAQGQHRLHRDDVDRGLARPLGLSSEGYAAVLALTELGDDQAVAEAGTQASR
ncbi:hypothetical protein [Streptomyces sp. 900105245]